MRGPRPRIGKYDIDPMLGKPSTEVIRPDGVARQDLVGLKCRAMGDNKDFHYTENLNDGDAHLQTERMFWPIRSPDCRACIDLDERNGQEAASGNARRGREHDYRFVESWRDTAP